MKDSSARSFGIVFSVVFLIVGLWPLRADLAALSEIRWWAVVLSAIFLTVALVRPALLQPANNIWLRFGLLLHYIVNPLVMAILFFGVLTPFALVMRMFGKDPMRRKFDRNSASYWIDRESESHQSTMKNQF